MFKVECLAPERGHRIKVDTVDQYAIDGERHPVILAARPALLVNNFQWTPEVVTARRVIVPAVGDAAGSADLIALREASQPSFCAARSV